jgi:hypothetical protein
MRLKEGVVKGIGLLIVGTLWVFGVTNSRVDTQVIFDFSQQGQGTLPAAETYTVGTYSITLTGKKEGGYAAAALYYSSLGIGLDETPDHSISNGTYIQISTAGLSADALSVLLSLNNASGSWWQLFGSNDANSIGSYLYGTNTTSIDLLASNYLQYAYLTIQGGTGTTIAGLSITVDDLHQVPEPGITTSLLVGLVILLLSVRRARKQHNRH